MDGRCRRVPRRLQLGHLAEERRDAEFVRDDHAGPARERCEQRRLQAVTVIHGHHVQAAVTGVEPVVVGAGARVREQVALADRHELLFRRRARRQQHERDVVRRVPCARDGLAAVKMAKREAPGREACRGDEIDDGNAERYGTASRGARVVRGHDQRDRPQLRDITRELRFGVGGVQRNVDRAARDTQEADGGIGAPRQRARHAIAATDAVVGEAVPDARKPGRQVGEAQRLATELEQRRNVGCRPGQRFERRPERRVRQIDDVSLVPRDADVSA